MVKKSISRSWHAFYVLPGTQRLIGPQRPLTERPLTSDTAGITLFGNHLILPLGRAKVTLWHVERWYTRCLSSDVRLHGCSDGCVYGGVYREGYTNQPELEQVSKRELRKDEKRRFKETFRAVSVRVTLGLSAFSPSPEKCFLFL